MLKLGIIFAISALFCASSDAVGVDFNMLAGKDDYNNIMEDNSKQSAPMLMPLTDPLSLLTKYAGMPYNLIYGNPEGDYEIGSMDPGLELTHPIIEFTYDEGKTAIYNGMEYQVPDQVEFSSAESCAAIESTTAYSGSKSYQ